MMSRDGDSGTRLWRAVAGVALLAAAMAGLVSAAMPDESRPAHEQGWGHRPGSPFLRALRDLNLSADQRASIDAILKAARAQAAAATQQPDFIALQNPGDPNHALAVQAAQSRAAAAIQQHSQVESRIYDLLTADQKAALPAALSRLKVPPHRSRQPWVGLPAGPA